MNYADIKLGTWFPEGGMYKIVEAMVKLAEEKGVKFYTSQEVKKFSYTNKKISHVITSKKTYDTDYVVCSGDYHHFDQNIIEDKYKNYSPSYWEKRILAPSSLLFYIGLDREIKNVSHHCLFFLTKILKNMLKKYIQLLGGHQNLFFVSFTSKTDNSVAPKNHENMFLLIPIAPDLEDNRIIRKDTLT